MLIGIISDSHDDMARLRQVVDLFNSEGVSHVIHAGDLISPFTFEVLGNLNCAITAIYGNNDGDKVLLNEKSGGTIHPQPHIATLNGKRIAIVHEPTSVDALATSGLYDLVIYGHTHIPEIKQVKATMVINPGKTATLHKGKSTVALLDLETMEAKLIEL